MPVGATLVSPRTRPPIATTMFIVASIMLAIISTTMISLAAIATATALIAVEILLLIVVFGIIAIRRLLRPGLIARRRLALNGAWCSIECCRQTLTDILHIDFGN